MIQTIQSIILGLTAIAVIAILFVTAIEIAEDRELKRIDLQTQSWRSQGYDIGN